MFEAFQTAGPQVGGTRQLATSAGAAIAVYCILIALAVSFGARAIVTAPPKRVEVTFNAPPPPPPPAPAVEPIKPRIEPKKTAQPIPKSEVAPPTAPKIEAAAMATPTEAPKTSAPEADGPAQVTQAPALSGGGKAGASLGVGSAGTVGGTGSKAINLPENGEPAVPSASNAAPRMPSEAAANGWEGRVVLKGVIGVDGTVTQLHVLRVTVKNGNASETATAEHPFAREALAALRGWKFTPAKLDGAPIAVYRIFNINFQAGVSQ